MMIDVLFRDIFRKMYEEVSNTIKNPFRYPQNCNDADDSK